MKSYNFLIGADPEVFLVDLNGKPISAVGLEKGTKDFPYKIDNDGHAVQVDNVMLEFNVPPADNPKKLLKSINFVLDYWRNKFHGKYKIEIAPSLIFSPDQLRTEEAKMFGCSPDFDAWEEKVNEPPDPETNLRTAGAHVHVGYKEPTMEKSLDLVKLFDLFITLPSLFYDDDVKRRKMYGKAGAFRFKPYGFEARQLSNFWIKEYKYIEFIFNQVEKCFAWYNDGLKLNLNNAGKNVVKAINTNDKKLAEKLIKEYKVL